MKKKLPNSQDEEPAWRKIAIFSDGSGLAGFEYDQNIKTIERWVEVFKLQRAFIETHLETLAGMCWKVAYMEPAIEIGPTRYRGEKISPPQMAQLWPEVKTWKRVKNKWREGAFHWEGELQGITLRLEDAEKIKPKPALEEGAINLADFDESEAA